MRSYEVDQAAQGPLRSLGFRRAARSPVGRTQLSERSRAQPSRTPRACSRTGSPRVGLHWEYHKVGGGDEGGGDRPGAGREEEDAGREGLSGQRCGSEWWGRVALECEFQITAAI